MDIKNHREPQSSYKPPFTPIHTRPGNRRWGNYWESFSPKIGRRVRFYSDLEFDHWLCVEFDPEIIEFCEQPFYVSLVIEAKSVSSLPDMWVRKRDGSEEVREVKYHSDISKNRVARQLYIQKEWCDMHGYLHRVITDHEIRISKVYLKNCSHILGWILSEKDSPTLNKQILKILGIGTPLTLEELCKQLHGINEWTIRSAVGRMIAQGCIKTDLFKTLTRFSTYETNY